MKTKNKFLYLFLILMSCDPGGTISIDAIDGNKLKFACGYVNLKASTTGGVIFTIEQRFSTTDTVTIYPDSLNVLYGNRDIPFELWNKNKLITAKKLTIYNDKSLYTDVKIDGGTTKGDTLLVITKGYIYCNNNSSLNDTIRIIIDKGFK